jgi:hypothetical protein
MATCTRNVMRQKGHGENNSHQVLRGIHEKEDMWHVLWKG